MQAVHSVDNNRVKLLLRESGGKALPALLTIQGSVAVAHKSKGLAVMWITGSGLLVIWFILKFVFHKGGFVHILLLSGISILVIQLVAYRKTRYQRR